MTIPHRSILLCIVLLLLAGCSLGPTAMPRPTAPPPTEVARAPSSTPSPVPPTHTPLPTATTTPLLPTPTAPPPTATLPPTHTPDPEPTATLVPPTSAPIAGIEVVIAGLDGLPIDEFFAESYKELLLRDPQAVSSAGLADEWGMGHSQLTNLSDAYTRETQALEVAVLGLLRGYDRAALGPEQRVTYDVYEWYLDNQVRGHPFMYHDYPVHHFLRSYDDRITRFFAELHPLRTEQEAQDYVARLSQVGVQVEQLLAGMEKSEGLGITPPRFIIDMALGRLRDLARSQPHTTRFYSAFAERTKEIDELDEAGRNALLEAVEHEIEDSVLPAFQDLVEYMEYLRTVASDDAGLWRLPDGDAYYAYMLRSETSTDLSPDEIHELGLAEVDRIQAEMRIIFDEMGYAPDAALGQLMTQAIEEGGFHDVRTGVGKKELVILIEGLLDEIQVAMEPLFDIKPEAEVVVVGDTGFSGGGYYVSASLDGSRPGAFHTGVGGTWVPDFNLRTVAYHEAIPGHHFQIAIAQEQDLPLLRNDLVFNAHAEGWALYSERLGWELGMFDDDPPGDLGRLQMELLRAVRLVADTGIHAKGWTREEGKAYMNEALGDPSGWWAHEIDRYAVLPAQATGYKVGMIKIMELRQRAMDALGDQYDPKEFHRVVIGNGSVPLEVLDRLVQDYIDAKSE